MSDFFSNLYSGIRRPDVVMNDGPLPPLSTSGPGYPAGFNGNPDGRINLASTLLGDVSPYSYAEADRLSTQAAYLNVPHRVQRIVPTITLPEAQAWESGGRWFQLSHQVDDGDVAFVIRAMYQPFELVPEKKRFARQNVLQAVDAVVNLASANYILHGLQRYGYDKVQHKGWNTLWLAFKIDEHCCRNFPEQENVPRKKLSDWFMELEKQLQSSSNADVQALALIQLAEFRRILVDYLVKNVIRPFGVPLGSERQGGQHQGSSSAITWPVDFVTTMTVDGLVLNLANSWRHDDINAGDDLMMYVENCEYIEYTLSHHSKNCRRQRFASLRQFGKMPEKVWKKYTTLSVSPIDNVKLATEPLRMPAPGPEHEYGESRTFAPFHVEEGGDDHFQRMLMLSMDAEHNHKIMHSDDSEHDSKKVFGDYDHYAPEAKKAKTETQPDSNLKISMEKGDRYIRVHEPIFQLVPGISSCTSGDEKEGVRNAVWNNGYWHIARSQVLFP